MPVKNATGGSARLIARANGTRYSDDPTGEGGDYYVNFADVPADEDPITLGGTWTNNEEGTGGNAAMLTNTSMQIRQATGTGNPRICCDGGAPHINYEDSIAWRPGFPGNQRVEVTVYLAPGYTPSGNHELEIFVGAFCRGEDDKVAIQATAEIGGGWALALHDGKTTAYSDPGGGWIVIYSAFVAGGTVADGDTLVVELDRENKTCKMWQNGSLRLSTQWATTHDEIDARAQATLNALGDGAGLGSIRRSGATEGAFGARDFRVSQTLLGHG